VASVQPRGQQGRAYEQEALAARLRDALGALMRDGASFRELTVAQIIATAGVARSTFYSHYADKPAMLTALSAQTLARLYDAPREWISKGADVTREDLVTGMRRLLDIYLENEVVMRAVAETSGYDAGVRDAYRGGVEDYARALARMIRNGRRAGRMRKIEPAETAEALAWMTERTVSQITSSATATRLDAMAEALADIFWRTLFP
jgi:AcrR family transcriptional regulator